MTRDEIAERLDAASYTVTEVVGLVALADAVRRLPVIATCRQCSAVGPCSGGWHCEEMVPPRQMGGPLVEIDAPPTWCPLRGGR